MGDHGDLAPVLEPDECLGIDLGDLGAGRIVVADGGHVADRAVGQMEQDDELLGLRRGVEDPRFGQDLELDRRQELRDRPWPLP